MQMIGYLLPASSSRCSDEGKLPTATQSFKYASTTSSSTSADIVQLPRELTAASAICYGYDSSKFSQSVWLMPTAHIAPLKPEVSETALSR